MKDQTGCLSNATLSTTGKPDTAERFGETLSACSSAERADQKHANP